MDDDEGELRNPFPSPPSHYVKYTFQNLELLNLLRERVSGPLFDVDQQEVLADQSDVPDWPLTLLQPPRVDWILEEPDAHFHVFGDTWFIKEQIPSLAESGGTQLYSTDPVIDRRPVLLAILRSLLISFSTLTESLLLPPPPPRSTAPPEWRRHTEWIGVLSQNLMAVANDYRPVQARGNLEIMMRRQLELRKSETEFLHAKCDFVEANLAQLQQNLKASLFPIASDTIVLSLPLKDSLPESSSQGIMLDICPIPSSVTNSVDADQLSVIREKLESDSAPNRRFSPLDVLRWAEEVC